MEEARATQEKEPKKGCFGCMLTCFNRDKLQIRKVSNYFVSRTSKKSSEKNAKEENGSCEQKQSKLGVQKQTQLDASETDKLTVKVADDRLSKINHLSMGEEEFLEKGSPAKAYSGNGEEASLTQIVIAQIEHDNNERNRKAIESPHNRMRASRGTNGKDSLDRDRREQRLAKSIDGKAQNEEQQAAIKSKLNVPLNLTNGDKVSEDPIYDVPPSKSLVNLSSEGDEETSLQKQHHIHVNSDLAYFHTSSPNIFLNVQQEESIYDTPSTRSLAS